MEASKQKNTATQNAVKLIGESLVPGASLLMDGEILSGGAHLVVGLAAKALLGPIGLGLVVANSYAKSTTGKNLLKQFTKDEPVHTTTTTTPATTMTTIKPVS